MNRPLVEVRRGRRGRGVYSLVSLPKGELIMDCPVILLKSSDIAGTITNYTFVWSGSKKLVALALGYGCFLNHSYEPNAVYKELTSREIIRVRSIRDIKLGEEILINYNGLITDKTPVWFDVK